MSFLRHAKRVDTSQEAIVDALRKAGWEVWVLGLPVDLLCWKAGRGFYLLECKTARGKKNPKAVIDKRQIAQNEFIELTGVKRVTTPVEALQAVGEML